MKKQARVLKLGLMAAILAMVAIFPVMMVDAVNAEEVDRIPFALETLQADKMPPVFFAHDKHIAAVGEENCVKCHIDDSPLFLKSEEMSADKVVAYVHKECVSCHATMGKGPALASCRSCHNDAIAAAQAAADKK